MSKVNLPNLKNCKDVSPQNESGPGTYISEYEITNCSCSNSERINCESCQGTGSLLSLKVNKIDGPPVERDGRRTVITSTKRDLENSSDSYQDPDTRKTNAPWPDYGDKTVTDEQEQTSSDKEELGRDQGNGKDRNNPLLNFLRWLLYLLLLLLLLFLMLKGCEKQSTKKIDIKPPTVEKTPEPTPTPKATPKPTPRPTPKSTPKPETNTDEDSPSQPSGSGYKEDMGWILHLGKVNNNIHKVDKAIKFNYFLKQNTGKLSFKNLSKNGIPKLCEDFNTLGHKCKSNFFKQNKQERDTWARDIINMYQKEGRPLKVKGN